MCRLAVGVGAWYRRCGRCAVSVGAARFGFWLLAWGFSYTWPNMWRETGKIWREAKDTAGEKKDMAGNRRYNFNFKIFWRLLSREILLHSETNINITDNSHQHQPSTPSFIIQFDRRRWRWPPSQCQPHSPLLLFRSSMQQSLCFGLLRRRHCWLPSRYYALHTHNHNKAHTKKSKSVYLNFNTNSAHDGLTWSNIDGKLRSS